MFITKCRKRHHIRASVCWVSVISPVYLLRRFLLHVGKNLLMTANKVRHSSLPYQIFAVQVKIARFKYVLCKVIDFRWKKNKIICVNQLFFLCRWFMCHKDILCHCQKKLRKGFKMFCRPFPNKWNIHGTLLDCFDYVWTAQKWKLYKVYFSKFHKFLWRASKDPKISNLKLKEKEIKSKDNSWSEETQNF